MLNDAQSAAKNFDVNCLPFSVRIMSSMLYDIIQSSMTNFATCGAAILAAGTACVVFLFRSVITMINQFPYFVGVSGPRILMAIASKGPDGGNSFSNCGCLS